MKKYGRTYHLPMSPGASSDDKIMSSVIQTLLISWDDGKAFIEQRRALSDCGRKALPEILASMKKLRTWRAREAVVDTAIKFARNEELAREIGQVGLLDKCSAVRGTACALSAFSLNLAYLPCLKMIAGASDQKTKEDAEAAILAISQQNHHLFMDRDQSGKVRWNVMGSGVEDDYLACSDSIT